MTRASDILAFLNEIAPTALAESWDNVGLLAGDEQRTVLKALVALDITGDVCKEAEKKNAQLIISHHPILFRPAGKVTAGGEHAALYALLSRGLTAICMHTNLDAAPGGVGDTLLDALDLIKCGPLLKVNGPGYKKIVIFVPPEASDKVREAMADAGAGKIGNYDRCAFDSHGTGYFRPLNGSHPYLGEEGKVAEVGEVRIEAVCRAQDVGRVVAAARAAHPYEEPAFDIFADEGPGGRASIGSFARLPEKEELEAFARFVAKRLGVSAVQLCRSGKYVQRLAVCSGAWDDELTLLAARAGADTILTGEIKHSGMLLARELSLSVIAAGHFATENVIVKPLRKKLSEAFPEVAFEVAKANSDPSCFIFSSDHPHSLI